MFLCVSLWAQNALKGTVKDQAGVGLTGVSVSAAGTTNKATATDGTGNYNLALGNGTYQVSFMYVGYGTVTKTVIINGSDVVLDVSMSASVSELEGVVVSVGSRSSQRTITDSPLPIDILSATDLRNSGQPTFDKALQYRVPSFNTVNTPVNDASSLLDPYEIRNMGPSRTLVLINGKRKNASSLIYIQTSPGRGEGGADISAIPTEAIKRVEILRDGASAQYGSDAIAGVMNIILKDKANGGAVTLNTGITHKGDGKMYGLSLNNGGILGNGGFVNYTVALSNQGIANRPGTVDAQGEANDFGADLSTVQAFLAKHPDAGNINGQPATAAAKFLINAGMPVNDKTEFYANAAYVYKKVSSFANYRTPYWRPTDYGLLTPAGQPYEGYVPTFEGDLNDYHGTMGFRTNFSGWQTDVSFTTGGNKQIYTVANTINRGLGINSPILFKPGGYSFSHIVGNIDVTKALTNDLHLGVGTEFRSEKFVIIAGDTASYKTSPGADSFPGIGANNAGESTRYNIGGYLDLGWDISKAFLINGTIRFEKYSDAGGGRGNYGNQSSFYNKDNVKDQRAFVWKVSSRYKVSEKVTLRGSASTGFRAPSLHQINLQIAQASFVPGSGIQTKGIVNNRSAQAKVLGVPTLKSEKSNNFTLGLGLNPTKNVSISVDYYNIKVKDRIILGSEISGTEEGNTQLDQVLQNNGIVAVSFFTNALKTLTSGIDVVTSFRNIALGNGKLGINVSGNFQFQSELDGGLDGVTNPKIISDAGKSVFDATQEALLLTSRPKFKIIVGGDYRVGKVNFNLNNTVFGPTTFHQAGIDANLDTKFKTKIVTDLGVNFGLSKNIDLGINIQNMLNVLPEWEFIALNSAGEALLKDAAQVKTQSNLITFNQRYAIVTYDGSHFSQLGLTFAANLTIRF